MNEKTSSSENHVKGDKQAVKSLLEVEYRLNLQTNNYDYISPLMEKITGFSAQENLEMSNNEIFERIHPDDRLLITKGLEQAFDIGFGTLVYRFKHKDGEYRWFVDHLMIIKDQNCKPLYSEGIVRDITEIKEKRI